jgi:L-iditol 2-dehydrogenase
MRAAFLTGDDAIEIKDTPEPTIHGPSEVLVEVEALSVCMTDAEIIHGHMKTKKLPIILGHEGAGRVVAKGEKVDNVQVEDQVLIDPNLNDLTCPSCTKGFLNLCQNGGLMGRETDGVFREGIVLPSRSVYRVPMNVPMHVAPLIQPFSTVVHAHRKLDVAPGSTVLVIGLGVAGLMFSQLAKMRGAFVIASSGIKDKLDLAKSLGVDVVVDRNEEDLESRVTELTGGTGVDVVIDSSGYPKLLQKEGLRLVRPHGTLLLFATRMNDLGMDSFEAYKREIVFKTTRSSLPEDFEDAVRLVALNRIDLRYQITKRFKFEQLDEALSFFQDRATVLKTVISMH